LDADGVRRWVVTFLDAAEREVADLGELDRQSGDGDFGTNLTTSIRSARAALGDGPPGRPADSFAALSTAFLGTGGTSGPLFGMWFRELARAAGDETELTLRALAAGVRKGLDTVRRLGGAAVGDKTMIDAIQPAADALAQSAQESAELRDALAGAAHAAREGAEATATLVARRGRASYVGEVSRGVVDPGAATVALWFESTP
jgi:dihydroxyacetone kinase phosphoprotein-dependent L subunit